MQGRVRGMRWTSEVIGREEKEKESLIQPGDSLKSAATAKVHVVGYLRLELRLRF